MTSPSSRGKVVDIGREFKKLLEDLVRCGDLFTSVAIGNTAFIVVLYTIANIACFFDPPKTENGAEG